MNDLSSHIYETPYPKKQTKFTIIKGNIMVRMTTAQFRKFKETPDAVWRRKYLIICQSSEIPIKRI